MQNKKIKLIIVSDHVEMCTNMIKECSDIFEIVKSIKDNPDFVVSFGGDGTYLKSEFLYPNITKIFLKYSRKAILAHKKSNQEILKDILSGDFSIEEKNKLEASCTLLDNNKKLNKNLLAFGDVLVHNKDPRNGIRCRVYINGKALQDEDVIGDGLLIATQIGSTGYYKSITRSYFTSDDMIGLAFNNSTEQINHIILKKDSEIKVEITRGVWHKFLLTIKRIFLS
jgi:NAD+ kinase